MQKYSHSGIIPIGGALLCLVGSAVATALVAVVYALIIRFIPFVYLNFLATLGFGLAMGFMVAVLGKFGKIRSKAFILFAWLLTLAVGYYVYWGATIWTHEGLGLGLRVFEPREIISFAEHLFQFGSWGIFGAQAVTGWFLVAFWLGEIGCLGWFSYMVALAEVDQPFCEICNQWTETEKGVAMFNATGSEPEWDNLKLGDYSALTRLPMLASSQPNYVRVDVEHCPQCGNSNFLNIYTVQVKVDDEGAETTTETKIISNVILSQDQLTLVRELVDRAAEEAAAKLAAEGQGDKVAG
jgi:hypothetical protein